VSVIDFSFTKEQNEYRSEVIRFSKEVLNIHPNENGFSRKMWKEVSDFGLLGMMVGESYGGMGESYLTTAISMEALGYACKNNGFVFAIGNHIWAAQNLIDLYGSDYLKEKYLRKMIVGECIGAFALTEAEAGSDSMNISTKAVAEGDSYILNGNKIFISNGTIADIFILLAVTNDKPRRVTAFVVENSFSGLSVGKEIGKLGLKDCPTSEVILTNCRIPKENILGYVDRGENIITAALEWERCFEFAPHIGTMNRVMEQCIKYVNERKQFDQYIKKFQAISHKIADMKVSIEMSLQMLYKIAWLKDNGKTAFLEASIFKLFVSEHYIKLCQDALQIFGAYGYSTEYEIERELRDSLASSIYSGTSEIQRNTIFNLSMLSPYLS